MDFSKTLRIKNSRKHGKGIYATVEIPRGEKIIEYVGRRVTKKQSDDIYEKQMKKSLRNGGGHVYLFTLNNSVDIDGNVSWNRARLINHSCDPNCEVDILRGKIWILSRKKIQPGEELTYDYGFNMDSWEDHVCRCGSDKCLGYIVSASRRGALARVLKSRNMLRKKKKRK